MGAPEALIKKKLVEHMERLGWYVIVTHGNMFQAGLPDLYCAHKLHGQRWVEVKHLGSYRFTDDQLRVFPELAKRGVQIWVLATHRDPSAEQIQMEYQKLWKPGNWWTYLK